MSNPTTPFNWQMPTSTDLVTDLPADFEVFGQAVASSMADLLGGTTGQILSKASNTDMDFTWIANDQGDITAVNVTSPITGGGSAGAVTVGIQDASTTQKGAVQLSDSTSTTSSILAATPTAVKSSYDLAAAAIPKSTVTTNGDIIYGTGSGTVTRLGVGSTGQVLTVAAGVPSWATASSGLSAATQAEMETASSTAVAVTPGRQQYHPSAAKGWANFNGTSTYTINASYNVSSVSSIGTAQYRVSWDVDFSSANYAYTMNCDKLATDAPTTATMIVCNTFTVAAGYMDFALMCVNGTRSETSKIAVTAFGDQ